MITMLYRSKIIKKLLGEKHGIKIHKRYIKDKE